MGSLFLIQGIVPTQGSNPGLSPCRQSIYQLSHKGSPDQYSGEYSRGTLQMGSPGGLLVMNLLAMQKMQEMQVQSLGGEDPLEEEMATHSSILSYRIPIDRGAWQATVHGVTKGQT